MDLMYSRDPNVFNKPELVRIGNCQFRRFRTEETRKNENQLGPYTEHDEAMINCAELDDDIEIKVTKSGQFLTTLHVAPREYWRRFEPKLNESSYFYKGIIGSRGSRKQEIEAETGTHIKIPRSGEIGDVVITGTSERDICSARNRINLIILKMRDTHPVTHFISIPMLSEQIKTNFLQFKSQLLNGPPIRGIEDSIFLSPEKLHLTVTTFVLLDDFEIKNAIGILQDCKGDVIDPLFKNAGPIKIIMEGIEIMNDDPTAVDVLYGKVKLNLPKYNTSFQKMSDQIVDYFARRGLIRQQYDNVKLHVTLMNSRYRRKGTEAGNDRRSSRESFDASFILDKYRKFYFGEAEFNSVHLSVRFTTGDEQYYESATAVSVI